MRSTAHSAVRAVSALLTAVAVAPLLCGCGASDTTAYCAALEAADTQWSQAGASLEDKAAAAASKGTGNASGQEAK